MQLKEKEAKKEVSKETKAPLATNTQSTTQEIKDTAPNMKLAFIEVRYKEKITLPEDFLKQLPKKVILFTNIQYHPQYAQLKEQLEKKGIEVKTTRPKHAWNEGQILGCSVEDWSSIGAEAFVYIGDGFFHPKAILFQNPQPVFMYDPEAERQYILTQKDIEIIAKRRKGAMLTFHTAENVGVLITTKYGQGRLKESLALQEKYPKKKFFFFMADVIDFPTLEDFPFIQVYVNTACPRIMDDIEKLPRPMVNIQDINNIEW